MDDDETVILSCFISSLNPDLESTGFHSATSHISNALRRKLKGQLVSSSLLLNAIRQYPLRLPPDLLKRIHY